MYPKIYSSFFERRLFNIFAAMYNSELLMEKKDVLREAFNDHRVCVIIPTYNNSRTLRKVVEDVAAYTSSIIVVNDGSTDDTTGILEQLPGIALVSYPVNQGKGWAIRQGFVKALSLGYQYAITIDSDGQHFAKDLPIFLEQLKVSPGALIIGARNMHQESVPGRIRAG